MDLNLSYSYATIPPLFADLGDFHLQMNNTNVSLTGMVHHDEEDNWASNISGFAFDSLPLWITFDSVSDFGHVWGYVATYIDNVIVERVMSISDYVNEIKGYYKI